MVCPGTQAGPAWVCACLHTINVMLAGTQPPGCYTSSLWTHLLPRVLFLMLEGQEDSWRRSSSLCLGPLLSTSWGHVSGPGAQALFLATQKPGIMFFKGIAGPVVIE